MRHAAASACRTSGRAQAAAFYVVLHWFDGVLRGDDPVVAAKYCLMISAFLRLFLCLLLCKRSRLKPPTETRQQFVGWVSGDNNHPDTDAINRRVTQQSAGRHTAMMGYAAPETWRHRKPSRWLTCAARPILRISSTPISQRFAAFTPGSAADTTAAGAAATAGVDESGCSH